MSCPVKLKACRRCGGDLYLEQDRYGSYTTCIQCGAAWNEAEVIPDKKPGQPAPDKCPAANELSMPHRENSRANASKY